MGIGMASIASYTIVPKVHLKPTQKIILEIQIINRNLSYETGLLPKIIFKPRKINRRKLCLMTEL